MWGSIGPESERTSIYAADIQEDFSDKELRPLALERDIVSRQYGGLYHFSAGLQESELRHLLPQLEYVNSNRGSTTSQYPAAVGILDQLVRAEDYNDVWGDSPILRPPRNHTQKTNSVPAAENCGRTVERDGCSRGPLMLFHEIPRLILLLRLRREKEQRSHNYHRPTGYRRYAPNRPGPQPGPILPGSGAHGG